MKPYENGGIDKKAQAESGWRMSWVISYQMMNGTNFWKQMVVKLANSSGE